MLDLVLIRKLKPNPYRRIEEYPILREKVDALKESIATTGFWGTIVARPHGEDYQIAFGHHRRVALEEMLSPDDFVEVIVRDLSNEQMLKMMARENMEEWGTSAWVEMENVRAAIGAVQRGEIALRPIPKDTPKTLIQHVQHNGVERHFTKLLIAETLGWARKVGNGFQPNNACKAAFDAIEMIDAGLLKEADLKGLNRSQVVELVKAQRAIRQSNENRAEADRRAAEAAKQQAATAREERDRWAAEQAAKKLEEQAALAERNAKENARQFGKEAAEAFRQGEGRKEVQARAEVHKADPVGRTKPDVEKFADQVLKLLNEIARDGSHLVLKAAIVQEFQDKLSIGKATALLQEHAEAVRRLTDLFAWLNPIVNPHDLPLVGTGDVHVLSLESPASERQGRPRSNHR